MLNIYFEFKRNPSRKEKKAAHSKLGRFAHLTSEGVLLTILLVWSGLSFMTYNSLCSPRIILNF